MRFHIVFILGQKEQFGCIAVNRAYDHMSVHLDCDGAVCSPKGTQGPESSQEVLQCTVLYSTLLYSTLLYSTLYPVHPIGNNKSDFSDLFG